jgi:hypothetical protein
MHECTIPLTLPCQGALADAHDRSQSSLSAGSSVKGMPKVVSRTQRPVVAAGLCSKDHESLANMEDQIVHASFRKYYHDEGDHLTYNQLHTNIVHNLQTHCSSAIRIIAFPFHPRPTPA